MTIAPRLAAHWLRKMTPALAKIRTLLYYVCWFLPHTALWCGFASATFWILPKKWRYAWIVTGWCVPLIWGAKWILGIQYQVIGRENIPPSAVIVCNHQSTWEAMFMLALFTPQVPILKESLAHIPFFGWAVRSANGVTIDRSNPRRAAKKILSEGKKHLDAGVPYLVFYPEGTRNPPGALGKFSRSGAVLAKQAGIPLLPVSQNSGHFWRNGTLAYYPGMITVEIHPPIDSADCTVPQAVQMARTSIHQGLDRAPIGSTPEHANGGSPVPQSGSAVLARHPAQIIERAVSDPHIQHDRDLPSDFPVA